jgi:hypothetical protein
VTKFQAVFFSGKSVQTLRLVVNPKNEHASTFEAHDQTSTVPRLGSLDLLRLANYLHSGGFHLVDIDIVDARMDRLPAGERDQLDLEIREAIEFDGVAHARALLNLPNRHYTARSVTFHGDETGVSKVSRMGVVDTDRPIQLEQVLQSAHREIRIS